MRQTALALLITLMLAIAGPVTASDSLLIAYSSFAAEKNNQKHPATLTHTLTVLQSMATPRFCIAYDNNLNKNVGRERSTITVMHADESETVLNIADRVRNHFLVKCSKAGEVKDLVPGDVVVFDNDFMKFPRLKRKGERIDRLNINSIVVADGFPLPLGTVGAVPGDEEDDKQGGWFHSKNYNFQAPQNNFKHPIEATRILFVQHDIAAPFACTLYRNTSKKGASGKILSQVSFYRDDEMFDSLTYTSRVRKNKSTKCTIAPDLEVGDVVYFDIAFEGLPRLKKGKTKTDYAEVTGVVSANGKPNFASPTPGSGEPPPSGGFTSADLEAAAKVLKGARPAQLWRFRNNQPTIWTVIGPATKLGNGLGGIDPSTVGYGNTLAAAVADYEVKRGKLPAGVPLTSAEISGLSWFEGIATSGGPTSVRMPRGTNNYVGEFYRTGRGESIQTFGSLVATFNWLKSQGL